MYAIITVKKDISFEDIKYSMVDGSNDESLISIVLDNVSILVDARSILSVSKNFNKE